MPDTNQPSVPPLPAAPEAVPEPYERGASEDFFADDPPPAAAPAAAASPPPPAPAAKPKYTHPRWVERAAIEMGLGDEDIETTPTDALQQRIYQSSQRILRERQSNAAADDARAREQPSRPETPPAAPVDPYAGLNLPDDAGWDESFMGTWKNLVDRVKAQDAEIASLKTSAQQFQQARVQTVAERVQGFMAKHPHIYGESGNYDEFRHQALVSALGGLQQKTTLEHDLSKVHDRLFGGIPAPAGKTASPPPPAQAPQPDPTRESIAEAYRDGGLNRPTQRNPVPLPKGRAAALAAVENYRRDHELNGVQHEEDPSDGLP